MADVVADDRPLTFEDLIQWFEAGSKPASDWKVGAEHEKFVFRLGTYEPIPYGGPAGIQALLNGLMRFGWKVMLPIALANIVVTAIAVFIAQQIK